jgi:predicted acetylornithine/succinylornithine family transaminase
MPTYRRYPVTLVRGEGTRVFDADGRAYLDFAAGIASVPLGHGHPVWLEAVRGQLERLTHVSNLYSTEPQERLADRITDLAGFGSVFLSNSGAEANEAALKVVRRHGQPRGRTEVVALAGSFHGRTFATLAATGQPEKHAPFRPLPEGFVHVPPGDEAALEEAVGDRTAAVLLEPVLSEGGVIPLAPSYLEAARALCWERGAVLVLDEVQTGVGRCGTWFAFQGTPVAPDVFTLAKGLGNGLPIGATVAREELAFALGEHASTFGGGPVPCAAALAVLDVIAGDGLLENARVQGARLAAGLAEAMVDAGLPGSPRGRGLLVGASVREGGVTANDVVLALLERGALATTCGAEVVRCTPPLTVTGEEVDEFVEKFSGALRAARRAPAAVSGESRR